MVRVLCTHLAANLARNDQHIFSVCILKADSMMLANVAGKVCNQMSIVAGAILRERRHTRTKIGVPTLRNANWDWDDESQTRRSRKVCGVVKYVCYVVCVLFLSHVGFLHSICMFLESCGWQRLLQRGRGFSCDDNPVSLVR